MGFTHVGMCCKALRNANGVVELAHATLASGAAKKADQLTAKAAKQEKQLHKLQAKLAATEGTAAVGGTGKEPRTCYDEWIEERRRPFYDSEPELPVAVCA